MARRLGVSREDVVAAAVRIGDRDGLAGLTVAAVATEVGCRPPSVYHHVNGLDGLVRAVTLVAADHLTRQLQLAARDGDGPERLRATLLAAHRWGVGHPGRFAALCLPVDPDVDPELAAARAGVLQPVQDVLSDLGVPADRRAPLLDALIAAVRGSIASELDAGRAGSRRASADTTDTTDTADTTDTTDTTDTADTAGSVDACPTAGHALLVRLLLDHVDAIRPAVAP